MIKDIINKANIVILTKSDEEFLSCGFFVISEFILTYPSFMLIPAKNASRIVRKAITDDN